MGSALSERLLAWVDGLTFILNIESFSLCESVPFPVLKISDCTPAQPKLRIWHPFRQISLFWPELLLLAVLQDPVEL